MDGERENSSRITLRKLCHSSVKDHSLVFLKALGKKVLLTMEVLNSICAKTLRTSVLTASSIYILKCFHIFVFSSDFNKFLYLESGSCRRSMALISDIHRACIGLLAYVEFCYYIFNNNLQLLEMHQGILGTIQSWC